MTEHSSMSRSSYQRFCADWNWLGNKSLSQKKKIIANYVHVVCVTDCQIHKSPIMMHINKVAISSIDCLGDDPLSAPNQQLLPTSLAPHFMSLNHFLDLYESSPGTRETHAHQMCFLPLSCSNLIALSSLLSVSCSTRSWRLYLPRSCIHFFRGRFPFLSVLQLPDCHCANRTLNDKRWLDWPWLK